MPSAYKKRRGKTRSTSRWRPPRGPAGVFQGDNFIRNAREILEQKSQNARNNASRGYLNSPE